MKLGSGSFPLHAVRIAAWLILIAGSPLVGLLLGGYVAETTLMNTGIGASLHSTLVGMIGGTILLTAGGAHLGCRVLFRSARISLARTLVYSGLSVGLAVVVGAHVRGQFFDGDFFEPATLRGALVGAWFAGTLATNKGRYLAQGAG
jgi:hypothetical protein